MLPCGLLSANAAGQPLLYGSLQAHRCETWSLSFVSI